MRGDCIIIALGNGTEQHTAVREMHMQRPGQSDRQRANDVCGRVRQSTAVT